MKHCWICRQDIPDGEESKDHVVPKNLRTAWDFGREQPWFWADKPCNNARANVPVTTVEWIQRNLDQENPGWTPFDIRRELRAQYVKEPGGYKRRRRKLEFNPWVSAPSTGQTLGNKIPEEKIRHKLNKKTGQWLPKRIKTGEVVWQPSEDGPTTLGKKRENAI